MPGQHKMLHHHVIRQARPGHMNGLLYQGSGPVAAIVVVTDTCSGQCRQILWGNEWWGSFGVIAFRRKGWKLHHFPKIRNMLSCNCSCSSSIATIVQECAIMALGHLRRVPFSFLSPDLLVFFEEKSSWRRFFLHIDPLGVFWHPHVGENRG